MEKVIDAILDVIADLRDQLVARIDAIERRAANLETLTTRIAALEAEVAMLRSELSADLTDLERGDAA